MNFQKVKLNDWKKSWEPAMFTSYVSGRFRAEPLRIFSCFNRTIIEGGSAVQRVKTCEAREGTFSLSSRVAPKPSISTVFTPTVMHDNALGVAWQESYTHVLNNCSSPRFEREKNADWLRAHARDKHRTIERGLISASNAHSVCSSTKRENIYCTSSLVIFTLAILFT